MGGIPLTAFVLGGGGVLGSAEVGMLRALLERGVVPDLIVGSSVGALNGVAVAAHPTLDAVDRLSETWAALQARDVFSDSVIGQIGNLVRSGTHLHGNQALRQLVVDSVGAGARIEALPVRFQCVAACIEEAAARWFESGPVDDAVVASCAVPGLMPPVVIDGLHYMDGGLVASVPVGRAAELGARRIFILHVGRLEQSLRPPSRPWEVALVAFEIARRHQFSDEMARLGPGIEVHVLPAGHVPPALMVRYRSPASVRRRIDSAYDATSAYLERIRPPA